MGHKLTPVEIDNLMRGKWSYKWEVPALGMSNCKWIGTGKRFIKVVLFFLYVMMIMSVLIFVL